MAPNGRKLRRKHWCIQCLRPLAFRISVDGQNNRVAGILRFTENREEPKTDHPRRLCLSGRIPYHCMELRLTSCHSGWPPFPLPTSPVSGLQAGVWLSGADKAALLVPTTASVVLCFSEQDTLCGGHTWPWAVRYHAAFDAPANAPQEFWHRQPIDLDPDGVIFCGYPRWKAAAEFGLTRVPGHVSRDLAVETTRVMTRHRWKRHASGGTCGEWRTGQSAPRPVGGGVAGSDGSRPAGSGRAGGAALSGESGRSADGRLGAIGGPAR